MGAFVLTNLKQYIFLQHSPEVHNESVSLGTKVRLRMGEILPPPLAYKSLVGGSCGAHPPMARVLQVVEDTLFYSFILRP